MQEIFGEVRRHADILDESVCFYPLLGNLVNFKSTGIKQSFITCIDIPCVPCTVSIQVWGVVLFVHRFTRASNKIRRKMLHTFFVTIRSGANGSC